MNLNSKTFLKKKQYLKKVTTLIDQYPYYGLFNTKNLSNPLRQKILRTLRDHGLKPVFFRPKIVKRQCEIFSSITEEGDLLVFAKDLESIKKAVPQCIVEQYAFLKENQVCEKEILLRKGPLKIKAGPNMALFEQIGNIKITKGFIDLMEQVILVKQGGVVDGLIYKILNLLEYRLKRKSSKLSALGSRSSRYSSQLVSILMDRQPFLQHFAKVLRAVGQTMFLTPKFLLAEKAAKIVYCLNKLNGLNQNT